jgi:hypothetical protein
LFAPRAPRGAAAAPRHGGRRRHNLRQERALVRAPHRRCAPRRSQPLTPLTPRTPRARLATNPLNRYTVIDYFAITHFYERDACLNEAALAQGLHRSDTQCVALRRLAPRAVRAQRQPAR